MYSSERGKTEVAVPGSAGANEVPLERMSGRSRARILAAALLLLGVAVLVLLLAAAGGPVDPGIDAAPFLTDTACEGCHNVTYAGWLETGHASAWDGLQGSPNATTACERCHVTGFGEPGGFLSFVTTPEMVNVQCEECHGPGTNHVGAPPGQKKATIAVNYSAELCGTCHQGEHHPFYNEWALSGHSEALVNLRRSPAAEDSCLQCHSADYILETEPSARPTLGTAQQGLTCVVCHEPHGSQHGKELRMPRAELCASCHNPGTAFPGDPIYHPQSAMRAGFSNADVPADEYMPTVNCDDCHMYAYVDSTRIPPVVTGHSFRPKPEACASCHGVFSIEESAALIDRWQSETMDILTQTQYHVAQAEVALDRAPGLGFGNATLAAAQRLYDQANYSKNLVTADGSMGAHNPDYAKNLLLDAKQRAQGVVAMLTPGRVTGRLVGPNGEALGSVDIRSGGVTWTTTDSEGRFSFQFAQGTHSFSLHRGDVQVGALNAVSIVANEESDVGTLTLSTGSGGGDVGLLTILVGTTLLAAVVSVILRRPRRGGKGAEGAEREPAKAGGGTEGKEAEGVRDEGTSHG